MALDPPTGMGYGLLCVPLRFMSLQTPATRFVDPSLVYYVVYEKTFVAKRTVIARILSQDVAGRETVDAAACVA